MDDQNSIWDMTGTYRVYSIDRTQWVEIKFEDGKAFIDSNGSLEVVVNENWNYEVTR